MIHACRSALDRVGAEPAHAGLLLASYLKETGDKGAAKLDLLKRAIDAVGRARPLYEMAFRRWERETEQYAFCTVKTRGRLVVGLGGESVLETGITLHHT